MTFLSFRDDKLSQKTMSLGKDKYIGILMSAAIFLLRADIQSLGFQTLVILIFLSWLMTCLYYDLCYYLLCGVSSNNFIFKGNYIMLNMENQCLPNIVVSKFFSSYIP